MVVKAITLSCPLECDDLILFTGFTRAKVISEKMDDILGVRVVVHPVALFSIVDSHERRQDSDMRVIGSLLGVKPRPGVVEVLSGYAVPHNETTDEVGGRGIDMLSPHQ